MTCSIRQLTIRSLLALVVAVTFTPEARLSEAAPPTAYLLDELGRQLVPGGYVVLENVPYTKIYTLTVNELDRRGIGGIKAWFCGARKPIPVRGSTNGMTRAIFSDRSPAGRVERKYITDIIVRPRPLVVAGRLERHGTDFATLAFEMTLRTDPALGATIIFVSEERHYPRGFRVDLSQNLTLTHGPGSRTLNTVRARDTDSRIQAEQVHWDEDRQHLVIEKWISPGRRMKVRILPERRNAKGREDSLAASISIRPTNAGGGRRTGRSLQPKALE